jgi:2-dehydro-3-deoxyphosphogluconate aldolase / (4S)-4-hydroxy-2-oxoglutarate aldolase
MAAVQLQTRPAAIPSVLEETRVVAILRHTAPELAIETVAALLAGGVRAIEVTFNSAGALDMLRAIRSRLGDRIVLGAGTVLDRAAAEAALGLGAAFVVSPHVDPSLVEFVAGRGVACIPGALSPTEVLTAWRAGAAVVKLFPAGSVGPSFVKDLRGPLGHIPLLPTGGVTLDNAAAFVQAGAWGLGIGSALADAALIRARRFDELEARARRFAQIAASARAGPS